jgi:hypothetical protein
MEMDVRTFVRNLGVKKPISNRFHPVFEYPDVPPDTERHLPIAMVYYTRNRYPDIYKDDRPEAKIFLMSEWRSTFLMKQGPRGVIDLMYENLPGRYGYGGYMPGKDIAETGLHGWLENTNVTADFNGIDRRLLKLVERGFGVDYTTAQREMDVTI